MLWFNKATLVLKQQGGLQPSLVRIPTPYGQLGNPSTLVTHIQSWNEKLECWNMNIKLLMKTVEATWLIMMGGVFCFHIAAKCLRPKHLLTLADQVSELG